MIRIGTICSLCYLIASVIAWLFPSLYLAELWISFLPYRMWGGWSLFFCLIGSIIALPNIVDKKVIVSCTLAVLLCAVFYTSEYFGFYTFHHPWDSSKEGLSIFYANIRWENTYMDDLYGTIQETNPDVVVLVEYTPTQHDTIYPLLESTYPYIVTDYPESGGGGHAVYAKYPLRDLVPTLEGEDRWKYGYVSISYKDKDYIVYAIHTSAPVDRTFLAMRNNQLEQLGKDLLVHKTTRSPDARVIVLGDFNVSPWSGVYQMLEDALEHDFTNMIQFMPGTFTRSLFGSAGVIVSTIDHIWTNYPQDIHSILPVPIKGSDHRGWLLNID